jgi:hypothetical protein
MLSLDKKMNDAHVQVISWKNGWEQFVYLDSKI